jgi:plastocyanin
MYSFLSVGDRVVIAAFVAIVASACGGGNSPTSPSPAPGPSGGGGGTAAATISIVGDRGAQSFTPNPASAGQGQSVAWRNTDNVVHHIVSNDGTVDTGDIAPGATATRVLQTNGTNYHCTIHPGMIGGISASAGEPPPACTGAYCG